MLILYQQGFINNQNLTQTSSITLHDLTRTNSLTISHSDLSYLSMALSVAVLATSSLASFKDLGDYLRDKRSFFHGCVIIFSQGFRIVAYITLLSYGTYGVAVAFPIWLTNLYYLSRAKPLKAQALFLSAHLLFLSQKAIICHNRAQHY